MSEASPPPSSDSSGAHGPATPVPPAPAPAGQVLEDPASPHSRSPQASKPVSTWAPLVASPSFRMLWGVTLAANICMWMNDVAAAWMMTSLTTSPVLVALVQTASTLPVFLLGLPSGALADIRTAAAM